MLEVNTCLLGGPKRREVLSGAPKIAVGLSGIGSVSHGCGTIGMLSKNGICRLACVSQKIRWGRRILKNTYCMQAATLKRSDASQAHRGTEELLVCT